ncbi:hypothetical protein V1504DRAFT_500760 [Lipomyces starkeyi]
MGSKTPEDHQQKSNKAAAAAADLAIASHVLAIRTRKGVIHFFHQPEGEETPIPIEDVNQIYKIFDRNALVYGGTEGSTVANKVYWNDTAGVVAEKPTMEEAAKENTNVEQVNDNVDLSKVDYKTAGLFQATEAIFDLMRVAIGRTYKAFDYHGAANAAIALLIFGSSAQNFITTIGHAGWGDIYSKVGVITVRVYRPWSAEKLLAVIPRSVKRLAVLELVQRQTTKCGPVLLDVISSLNNDLSIAAAIPVVVGYQLGYLDSKTIRQALRGIVQNIQSEAPIQNLLPELETAYSKMLYNVFGDKLSILNALDRDDTGIRDPETLNAKEEKKEELVSKLQKAINENGFTNQETNDLVSRWLLLSSENSSKLSEVGAEVISKLESDSSEIAGELLNDKAFLLGTSSWIIGSDAWSYDLGTSGVHDAFIDADKFTGPSIIITYLPYNEETDSALTVLQETKKAVDSGHWPLYRWDPRPDESGLPNFQLDSQALKKELKDFLERENHLSQIAQRVPVFGENVAGSYGSELRSQQQTCQGDGSNAAVGDPPPLTNEDIKMQSNYLRGTIVEGLNDESTGAISASDSQVAKFHGAYLQDDRDVREQRRASRLEPAYSFMIRVRMPAGVATPAQWLAIDQIADDKGNGTVKVTTRGTYQLHGVIKKKFYSYPACQSLLKKYEVGF